LTEDKLEEQVSSKSGDDDNPKPVGKFQTTAHNEIVEGDSDNPMTGEEQVEVGTQPEELVKRLQTLLRQANTEKTSLAEENTRYKGLLGKTTDELARVRSEFNAYVAASKEGIRNLGRENEKIRRELQEKADQIVKLESKAMLLSQIGVIDSDEIDELKDDIVESSAKLRGENEALREALKKAEEKALKDTRKVHQLQKQLQETLEENRKHNSERPGIQVEIESLQNDRAILEQKLVEAQEARNDLGKQISEDKALHISLKKAREKVIEQQDLIDGLKAHISNLEGKHAAAVHRLEILDETENQLEQYSQKMDMYRTRISDLEGKYGAALHQLGTLEEKEDQIAQLNEQMGDYRKQIAELTYQHQQVDKQRQSFIKTQEELAELQSQYEQAKLEINRLERENITIQEYETQIEEFRKEITNYKSQIATLKAKTETLQKYKGRLSESQDAVSDMMSRIAGMASKITSLKAELKSIEEEKERTTKEQQQKIIQLNERNGKLQAELEKYIKDSGMKLETFQNEFEKIAQEKDEKIENYQTQLSIKNTEIAELELRTKTAEEQLNKLQESISRTIDFDEQLDQLSAESAKRQISIEKKLEIFELTADGMAKMKEDLVQEKELLQDKIRMVDAYELVLQGTNLGKVFLLVKALKTTNVDHLSRALGIPKLNLLPSIRELTQMGVIILKGKKVSFVEPKSEEPSSTEESTSTDSPVKN